MSADMRAAPRSPEYPLGHTEAELTRLITQARFYEHQTELLFRDAGLGPGQRVLDFGCGVGDVSFLAARMGGPSTVVIGVDRSKEAVATARARAEEHRLPNTRFYLADETNLDSIAHEGPFDAAVGRLVLMYQRDPADVVRRIAEHLKPGGVVAFHEVQLHGGSLAHPSSPVLSRLWTWLAGACGAAGVDLHMGYRLRRVLLDAGLRDPEVLLTARIEGGDESPAYVYLAETIRSLLPMIVKNGLETEAEVDIATLAERLKDEIVAGGGILIPSMMAGGWARRPA